MTLPDALVEQAHSVFRDEYQRVFPTGGDESDHVEAVRSAVSAVVEWAQTERDGVIVRLSYEKEVLRRALERAHEQLSKYDLKGPKQLGRAMQTMESALGVAHPEERAA